MPAFNLPGECQLTRDLSGAETRVIQAGHRRVVLSGYQGVELPGSLTDVRLETLDGDPSPRRWQLVAREGTFEFRTRSVEHQVSRPGAFDVMLSPFALRPRDRRIVGLLLGLLRLPGGAWLLRAWHARRR